VTLFETLKLIHVLAAIVWLGGGIMTQVLSLRMKTAEPPHRLGFARDMVYAGQRVFLPAAAVSLVFGVWMVLDRDAFEFSQAWILIGLIGLATTATVAAAFIIPQTKKAVSLIESGNGPAAGVIIGKVTPFVRINLLILVVVAWAMVFKPGLDTGNEVLFQTLLLVHVLAVMAWFGGGVISTVFVTRIRRADLSHRLGFVRDAEKASPVFGIASGIAALAGVWMVIDRPDYGFGQAWVIIGITGFVLSSIVGGALLGPTLKKLRVELESGGQGVALLQRARGAATIDQLLLAVVVWAMVFRPGI
jgi:uncharacterized membrane protein